MSKTMRQRLQSRISLRRNYITQLEGEVVSLKSTLQVLHDRDSDYITLRTQQFRSTLRQLRESLKELRDDQKLDKQLYYMVLQEEANQRFYQLMSETA